jgi:hypothetical protein
LAHDSILSDVADRALRGSPDEDCQVAKQYQSFPYLAVNSSNVSSSCPLLLPALVLLKPALAQITEVAGAATGALLADRKDGLRKGVTGVRAAIRKTEVDAISRRRGEVSSSEVLWCRLEEVLLNCEGHVFAASCCFKGEA